MMMNYHHVIERTRLEGHAAYYTEVEIQDRALVITNITQRSREDLFLF